jgi:hypothetical protein
MRKADNLKATRRDSKVDDLVAVVLLASAVPLGTWFAIEWLHLSFTVAALSSAVVVLALGFGLKWILDALRETHA